MTGRMLHSRMTRLVRGGYVAVCSLTILEFGWWLSGCIRLCFGNTQSNNLTSELRCPVACFRAVTSADEILSSASHLGRVYMAGEDGRCFCKFNLGSDVTTR